MRVYEALSSSLLLLVYAALSSSLLLAGYETPTWDDIKSLSLKKSNQ
jgi:hypothetical protein